MGDCCGGCDCDGSEPCVSNCCFTTDAGEIDETTTSTTKQFNCGAGGVWSVVGVGASIDQTGLLTTDGTACGTLTVTNTICGDQEVRVTDSGVWNLDSDVFTTDGLCTSGGCCNSASAGNGECDVVSGGTKTTYTWSNQCCCDADSFVENPGLPPCASGEGTCPSPCTCPAALGECKAYPSVNRTRIYSWDCP